MPVARTACVISLYVSMPSPSLSSRSKISRKRAMSSSLNLDISCGPHTPHVIQHTPQFIHAHSACRQAATSHAAQSTMGGTLGLIGWGKDGCFLRLVQYASTPGDHAPSRTQHPTRGQRQNLLHNHHCTGVSVGLVCVGARKSIAVCGRSTPEIVAEEARRIETTAVLAQELMV